VKQDPIFSGEAVKAILLLIVALAIGGGAVAVATGDLNLELPDIDIPEPSTDPTVTLSDTSLSDITIDEPEDLVEPVPETPAEPVPPPANQFDGSALKQAIVQITAELGPQTRASSLTINESQTQFVVLTGKGQVKAYALLSSGDLVTQDANVTITGNATLDDFSFKLTSVKPDVLDPMIRRAGIKAKTRTFRPTTLRLERDLSAGLKPPEWTINAEGDGRYLTFKADLDGRKVRNIGGAGVQVPQAVIDARELSECIKAAAQDFEQVKACFDAAR
jgi:hypothetical protein